MPAHIALQSLCDVARTSLSADSQQHAVSIILSQQMSGCELNGMQAEERLLKQLGLQQAAADAAAKQRAAIPGRTLRRRSSSVATREAISTCCASV